MSNQGNIPPKLAQKLLQWFLKNELLEEVTGDLEEKFELDLETYSLSKARRNYWYQVIKYIRPFAIKRSNNSIKMTMLRHYIKLSWRSILRHKSLSTIKIGGFAIGIAACMLIALYVSHELSYDSYYQDQDQIYRLTNQWLDEDGVGRWTNLQGPLKEVIEDNIPDIELVARTVFWSWGNAGTNLVRRIDSKLNIEEDGFIYADPELLEILEARMIFGSRKHALAEPNTLVMTKSMAEKYFPGQDPVGQLLVLNDKTSDTYTVGGVIDDFPSNSHLQADFILTLFGRKNGPGTSGWCCTNYVFYTKIQAGTSPAMIEEKLLAVRDTYVMDQLKTAGEPGLDEMQLHHSYFLQPINDVYINLSEVWDDIPHGSYDLVWIFGAIALIILILACVNFVNLTTAKSLQRAKEVGLRKVVGSVRGELISQYLSESMVFSLLAILLAVALAYVALPFFNSLADKSLSLPWMSWWFVPGLILVGLLIGLFAGVYPALYLSKFRPAQVLKGTVATGKSAARIRSGMVVFQFMVTIVLLIGAIVTQQQFQLIMNKSLGFDKDHVVLVHGLNTLDSASKSSLKAELANLSGVHATSVGDFLPIAGSAVQNRTYWLASERLMGNGFEAARWTIDEDYLETYDIELQQGKNFRGVASDDQSIIINERMAFELGLKDDAIGAELIDMFDEKARVIGVVKNFHFQSLFAEVEPLAMVFGSGNAVLSANMNSMDVTATINEMEQVWEGISPNQEFSYSFVDQRFQSMYDSLIRAKTLFIVFALLSIIIACLGLFALSAYMVEQRSKEVSIRKVLGASISGIFALLSFDFVRLVLVALVLAIPLGWFLMDEFLGDVPNRVDLSWYLFAVAGVLSLFIAVITISYETIKAALVNPATRLRSE